MIKIPKRYGTHEDGSEFIEPSREFTQDEMGLIFKTETEEIFEESEDGEKTLIGVREKTVHNDPIVAVWGDDKDYWYFQKSDVRANTPEWQAYREHINPTA